MSSITRYILERKDFTNGTIRSKVKNKSGNTDKISQLSGPLKYHNLKLQQLVLSFSD